MKRKKGVQAAVPCSRVAPQMDGRNGKPKPVAIQAEWGKENKSKNILNIT
jgi:hypothetical protein